MTIAHAVDMVSTTGLFCFSSEEAEMRLTSHLWGNRGPEKLNNQPQAPDRPAVQARELLSGTWALPLARCPATSLPRPPRCPGRLAAPAASLHLTLMSPVPSQRPDQQFSFKTPPIAKPTWFKLHFTNRLLFIAIRLVPHWEPSLLQSPPFCTCRSSWNKPILLQGQCRCHLLPQRPTGTCLSTP